MAEIIQFDATRKKPAGEGSVPPAGCAHKQVVAYTVFRTVRCALCGAELDPFDVLVDMLKASVPLNRGGHTEKKLQEEIDRRAGKDREEPG